jgi:NAD(P)-dependent dehydrogenase (short-subunit alcohol dehydrogenase family)
MAQRTVLVIGSGSAISDAAALALIADGHRVAITNSEASRSELFHVRCELASSDSIVSVFGEVEEALGPVQILVVDAGSPREREGLAAGGDDSSQATRIRLQAASVAAGQAIEMMRQAQWGRMIFLASSLAMVNEIGPDRYAAFSFNAGLIGLVEALTDELAVDNIAVNMIAPGLVDGDEKVILSPGTRKHPMWHIPAQRAGRPAEVAAAVSFLAGEGAAYVNGTTLRVDGGLGIRPGIRDRL